jgi:hypothetical protein
MNVARQFTAWTQSEKRLVPLGHGVMPVQRLVSRPQDDHMSQ